MFADTGVAQLLNRCLELGAVKSRLRVWLAGGSSVMDTRGVFNIGKRNQLAVAKALWKAGLLTLSEDLGGQGSRTVRLELETGNFLGSRRRNGSGIESEDQLRQRSMTWPFRS